MKGLRRTAFYRSLNRTATFMGGERELMLMTLVVSLGLVFTGMNAVALATGGVVWFVLSYLIRLMAKSDLQMSKVYRRFLRYRAFYPARSTPFRRGGRATR